MNLIVSQAIAFDAKEFAEELYNELPNYEPDSENTDDVGNYHELQTFDVTLDSNIGKVYIECVIEISGNVTQLMKQTHDHPAEYSYSRFDELYDITGFWLGDNLVELKIGNVEEVIKEFNKILRRCNNESKIV